MKKHTIITIGRQFGSGGHEVGKRLADRLGIPLYDRNLIQMAAGRLGVSEDQAEAADERLWGNIQAVSAEAVDYADYVRTMKEEKPLNDQIFEAQSELIRHLARRESCIIVGRCADYILENEFPCINAFIYAEIRDRIARIMRLYNLNEEEAWEKIRKVDRERKAYYEIHTGNSWGSIEAHQMLFNVSLLDMADVVGVLAAMYRANR
ncbi:MAG: cytidylate kinase-like family protein [Coprococcus sp.]|nr:cytidylate kinase-like family protein [Coprococcus sp.]